MVGDEHKIGLLAPSDGADLVANVGVAGWGTLTASEATSSAMRRPRRDRARTTGTWTVFRTVWRIFSSMPTQLIHTTSQSAWRSSVAACPARDRRSSPAYGLAAVTWA